MALTTGTNFSQGRFIHGYENRVVQEGLAQSKGPIESQTATVRGDVVSDGIDGPHQWMNPDLKNPLAVRTRVTKGHVLDQDPYQNLSITTVDGEGNPTHKTFPSRATVQPVLSPDDPALVVRHDSMQETLSPDGRVLTYHNLAAGEKYVMSSPNGPIQIFSEDGSQVDGARAEFYDHPAGFRGLQVERPGSTSCMPIVMDQQWLLTP